MNKLMNTLTNLPSTGNSSFMLFAHIISIIIGIALLGVSLYLKNKEKQWWSLVALLGVVSIITNVLQLFYQ